MAHTKDNTPPKRFNRRRLITTGPFAAAVAAAVASGAVAMPVAAEETPIMRLYREWSAIYEYLNGEGSDLPTEEFTVEADRRIAMEDAVLSMPVQGLADFAAKVLMASNHGDHDLPGPDYCPQLWAEARALVA